ncbi:TrkA-C domain protein [Methanosalsum zhilinae DSM 4017]|uniref:TrkA-C domain protein n=1 Tax=Methanosalsum zhilinae (strain DSM 4017 / NBRC 107636 / OCM 62 / WeN5) TaxID=679901 RepID=F7XKB4_METZD|nr:TrkA C-terminal domain-containing protein [Methanosalsum zhilinae]AEH60585.1 TrkA-C domain protein [Methanosalsum zhilinae DSM 4017]
MIAAFITLFAVIIVSLLITRVATIALTLTGLSREVARFQARSALTGSGFTTTESENMMIHPIRRRILMHLMLVGNAGIVTVIASTVVIFLNPAEETLINYLIVFIIGTSIIALITKSAKMDKILNRAIAFALIRWTDIEGSDSASLIYLGGDYQVSELKVESKDWLSEKTLMELNLAEEGVLVLGIQKPYGEYVGIPSADTRIKARDVLFLYGRGSAIQSLDRRRRGIRGELEHSEAVEQQKEITDKQEKYSQ